MAAPATPAAAVADAAPEGLDRKIQLYSLATPNGLKVSIALEEMGIPYEPHTVDIRTGEQFRPEFLALNPNNKIPVIVDPTGAPGGAPLTVFESGAILLYLAERFPSGAAFLPSDPVHRWEALQWLFWQVGGLGPMLGQFGQFFKYSRDKCDHPFPLQRYTAEAQRLLRVLETRLEGREYLVAERYTVADMAVVPWLRYLRDRLEAGEQLELASCPRVMAYLDRCLARPATARGLLVCPYP